MSAAADAAAAVSLLAVDPIGLGGACLRSPPQPARDRWLAILRELLPAQTAWRRIPFNISDGRLLGGLDLAGTLRANRPVAERGVLAAADGGVLIVSLAERLSAHTAACLSGVLDTGEVTVSRDGVHLDHRTQISVIALDEGIEDEEGLPGSLLDRLAFLIDLNGFDLRTRMIADHDAGQILAARRLLPSVRFSAPLLEALCATAMALGAGSVRVSLLALRAARAAAALDGRIDVTEYDATLAGRLVLAPRATTAPAAPPSAPSDDAAQADPGQQASAHADDVPGPGQTAPGAAEQTEDDRDQDAQHPAGVPTEPTGAGTESAGMTPPAGRPETDSDGTPPGLAGANEGSAEERLLAATRAAIPAGLLLQLRDRMTSARGALGTAGRMGALRAGGARGRPAGVRPGVPTGNARLNVLETLVVAAPWQRLRGRVEQGTGRLRVETGDMRVTRHKQRATTLTLFAVDVSGSSALNRLAEAKGAVELLLADCYIRRDQVAVLTFRGRAAELLLSPTRSLVRAKRCLAGVPGGGGTPLASALQKAVDVALRSQRRGETPTLVLLTDGRATVALNGAGGRELAHRDTLRMAVAVRTARINTLFVDTSPRPNERARELAAAMQAQYIALPHADARSLSRLVTFSRAV